MTWQGKGNGDSGWISGTLLNSWANNGGGFATAGYRRKNGVVYLKGLINGGARGDVAFVLPANFRPGDLKITISAATSTGAASAGTAHTHASAGVRVDVSTDGSVTPQGGSGNASLDGISFIAEQ